jgi:hypothetical protein
VQCEATKKNGEQCKGPAVKGQTQCAGHLGLGLAADPAGHAKRGAKRRHEVVAARAEARKRTAQDWLALELEANARTIVAAAVSAAQDGDWRAGAWLYERVYGKPQERLEVGQPGSVAEIAALSPDERKALRARLVAEHPELAELIPGHERKRPAEPDQAAAEGGSGA